MSELSDVVEVSAFCKRFPRGSHFLYKIENLVNSKVYIGVTKNLKHRYKCHLIYPNYKDEIRLVNLAVNKYGKENFKFEILCVGSEEYVYDLETKAIESFNSLSVGGHGYNLSTGGAGGKGPRGPVDTRADDVSVYVSGWWFPNKRTALKSLNWKAGLYNSRKRLSTLGNVCFIQDRKGPQNPVFVSGFWFPSKKMAMVTLNWTLSKYDHRKRNNQLGDLTMKNNSKGVTNVRTI